MLKQLARWKGRAPTLAAVGLLSMVLVLLLVLVARALDCAHQCGPSRIPPPPGAQTAITAPPPVEDGSLVLDYSRFHFDASGNYKVVPFVAVGAEWAPLTAGPVCLATHASVQRTPWALEALSSWAGPASVAVFDPDPPRLTALFLARLRACRPQAYRRAAFHAIIPADKSPGPAFVDGGSAGGCRGAAPQWILEMERAAGNRSGEFLYPQNLARNTAVQRCPTPWTMAADADMVAPPSLFRRLGAFLRARPGGAARRAYVVPTYEVVRPQGPSRGPPDTKAQLLRLKAEGKARQFHAAVFRANQGASQLSRWEASNNSSVGGDIISVAHRVRHFPFWYEPVYVTGRGAPPFDERFVGFGMTRNTQAYEMFLCGYTFEVLDSAFLVHWGFQELKQRPLWRAKQSRKNFKIFQEWILEKSVQYDADPNNLIAKMAGDQQKRKVGVSLRNSTTCTTLESPRN